MYSKSTLRLDWAHPANKSSNIEKIKNLIIDLWQLIVSYNTKTEAIMQQCSF
jgi:hypothetical protein